MIINRNYCELACVNMPGVSGGFLYDVMCCMMSYEVRCHMLYDVMLFMVSWVV